MVKSNEHVTGMLSWRIRSTALKLVNFVMPAARAIEIPPFEPRTIVHGPFAPKTYCDPNEELRIFERDERARSRFQSADPNEYGVRGNGGPMPEWMVRRLGAGEDAGAVATFALVDAAPGAGLDPEATIGRIDDVLADAGAHHTLHTQPERVC